MQAEKEWQVIQTYTDDKWPDTKSEIISHKKSKGLEFNESQHKSMNAELKFLYTAITRARSNLWIYDSDTHKSFPMFDYWERRGLVTIIRMDDKIRTTESLREILSAPSTSEEWESQGDFFEKKKLWEPAMKCYQEANCPHLELRAKAFLILQKSRLHKESDMETYLRVAHAFLESNHQQQNATSLENAAKCFKKCKMYKEASQLYAFLGQVSS